MIVARLRRLIYNLIKTSQMMDEYENMNHGIVIDVYTLSNLSLDRVDSMSSIGCTFAEGESNDISLEVTQGEDCSASTVRTS